MEKGNICEKQMLVAVTFEVRLLYW